MIQIDNVVAGYTAEVDILKGMTLHAASNEIVTLLGPNGCGKSTLLKTIAGFVLPREGRIVLENADVSQLPVHRKIRQCGVGFVPQTDNVFGTLTIRENLQVGGHYLSDSERSRRIDELCELYPVLGRKRNAPAASMSGGERQILALARALMPRPRLLLLDEPSAGLSPKVLHEVFDAIVRVRDQEQVTILMVEQNAMEALRISDRAYVLSMGTVALTGAANALLEDEQVRELYLGGRAA
ncbi:ABC transporter ATP-binding protein [Pandoraea sputorum]|uniref:Branched-chain amino acid ABC transporter ATPase n=6 Tax=Pandoraea TaxID=93217 RepID=A0A239SJG3_9BURK|nr:ABC transporter ATP-binding protein [Pandoraea sputorum]AJC17270.1 ABC transporter ATP-binding protein [Pandoraea sputorum]SNU85537.1 LIV-I protein F [Pandoraea sputorum]VVE36522.1 branched-chain amino acid ABC transporter ATPase [Pandoraea sputorum]VVE74379.1 branched-chain amino acid ABC transporter ATPase [Pandoraea sputorum]VVE81399.1 branched-chain amino acid ABC transporter ATPase [Pandoraea sputorum]